MHFGLDLSVHICIHVEKTFLLSSTSSIALHFIWHLTVSALRLLETQYSQMVSWSYKSLDEFSFH